MVGTQLLPDFGEQVEVDFEERRNRVCLTVFLTSDNKQFVGQKDF